MDGCAQECGVVWVDTDPPNWPTLEIFGFSGRGGRACGNPPADIF